MYLKGWEVILNVVNVDEEQKRCCCCRSGLTLWLCAAVVTDLQLQLQTIPAYRGSVYNILGGELSQSSASRSVIKKR